MEVNQHSRNTLPQASVSGRDSISLAPSVASSSRTGVLDNHSVAQVPTQQTDSHPHHLSEFSYSSPYLASGLRRYADFKKNPKASPASSSRSPSANTQQTESGHTYISDDFPKPSFLGKWLGDVHAIRCNLHETYFEPPELEIQTNPVTKRQTLIPKLQGIPSYIDDASPLPTYYGITGLNNRSGSCGVNAALQTLRVVLRSMLKLESAEKSEHLCSTIETKTPQLWRWINDQISTEGDRRKLHREVAHQLTADYWYSYKSDSGIAQQSRETGYIKGMHSPAVVAVLLHQLEAPQLYFTQWCRGMKTYHSAQTLSLEKITYSIEVEASHATLSMQKAVNQILKAKRRQLEEPLPSTLILSDASLDKIDINNVLEPLGNITGKLKTITLNKKDGSIVTYQPKSLLLLTDNHIFAILKKDDIWYEVNDKDIFALPSSWEEDLDRYATQYASMIIYERQDAEASTENRKHVEETLSQTTQDDIIEEGIINQLQRVYPKYQSSPASEIISDFLKVNRAQGENIKSFFFRNKAGCFLKQRHPLDMST